MELKFTGRDHSEDSQSHQATDKVTAKHPSSSDFPVVSHQTAIAQQ